MAVANTLAYYITATITAVKSFIVQAPVECHFNAVLLNVSAPKKIGFKLSTVRESGGKNV